MASLIKEFFVPSEKVEELNKILDRFQRKAKKWGVPGLRVEQKHVKREFMVPVIDVFSSADEPKMQKILVPGMEVEVYGVFPVIGGWELCGAISIEGGLVSAKTIQGKSIPVEWIEDAPEVCDHCHQKRYRVLYYVLQNEKNEYMKVGSSCVHDYAGNPHVFDSLGFDYPDFSIKDFNDSFSGGGAGQISQFELKDFLFNAVTVIDLFGYHKKIEGCSSGDDTLDMFFSPEFRGKVREMLHEKHDDLKAYAERVNVEVKEIIECVDSMDIKNSEYITVLKNLVKAGFVTVKTANFAASMIPMYRREKARQIERENSKGSEWVASVGEKIKDHLVTVTGVKAISGYYGMSILVDMLDNDENRIKFFYTGKDDINASFIGKKFLVSGRVKKHDEYNGTKQTVLTRAKLVEVEGA